MHTQLRARPPRGQIALVGLATLVGAAFRFARLGERPLWVDEVLFMELVGARGLRLQEATHVLAARLVGRAMDLDEFGLRFAAASFGTLSIPALYWVSSHKRIGVALAWFVAIFPLFVFWSRLARPYAVAGFFLILGWRFWPCHVLALLATPVAAIGLDPGRLRTWRGRWILLLLAALAVLLFWLRPDRERGFFTWRFVAHASRLWYLACLALALHLGERILPRLGWRDPAR